MGSVRLDRTIAPAVHHDAATTPAASSRAVAPDALKALAIFGVVYIHSRGLAGDTAPTVALAEVFKISVPIFITIWAYFHEHAYLSGRPWQSIVRTRFVSLAVPFLAWSLLYFLLTADLGSLTPRTAITRHWLGSGWSGQYFFMILLQLILVFPLVRRLPAGALSVGLTFGVFAAAFPVVNAVSWPSWILKLGFRPFPYWLPYVLLGMHLARNPRRRLPLGAAAVGVLLVAAEACLPWQHSSFDANYAKPGVLIGSGLVAAAFLNRRSLGRSVEILRPGLLLVGGNTMGIFLANPLIAAIAGPAIARRVGWQGFTNPAQSLATSLLVAALVLALCLASTLALKRSGLKRLIT